MLLIRLLRKYSIYKAFLVTGSNLVWLEKKKIVYLTIRLGLISLKLQVKKFPSYRWKYAYDYFSIFFSSSHMHMI